MILTIYRQCLTDETHGEISKKKKAMTGVGGGQKRPFLSLKSVGGYRMAGGQKGETFKKKTMAGNVGNCLFPQNMTQEMSMA
jgi:hypothetical protein